MKSARDVPVTTCTLEIRAQLIDFVTVIAGDRALQAAVEANHDANRWWPPTVADWRVRLLVAGWSARISYSMIDTYAAVVALADQIGFDVLAEMDDTELSKVIKPLGLQHARIGYLRSLAAFLERGGPTLEHSMHANPEQFIERFAAEVSWASFKVAQCATLYACGYHCGIIPVDAGMVTKLAACLGWHFSSGPIAHQEMRHVLEQAARTDAQIYRSLIEQYDYRVTVPDDSPPTWWLHLTLIYFKRFHCTYRHPQSCPGLLAGLEVPNCRALDAPDLA